MNQPNSTQYTWAGRFSEPMSDLVKRYTASVDFDKRLARCIGVDIRYVLYLMDKWGHADRLLKEINAK